MTIINTTLTTRTYTMRSLLVVSLFSIYLTGCVKDDKPAAQFPPIYSVGSCQLDKMLPSSSKDWVTSPGKITVEGWGYDGIVGNIPPTVKIHLRSSTGALVLSSSEAERIDRPDVAAFFKQESLLKAGFRSVLDTTLLPLGQYKMSVSMYQSSAFLLCETDRVLTIK